MNVNIKAITMKLKSSQAYSIALSGFVFAATLFFRIRNTIRVTILPQFVTQMFTTIREGKLNLTIAVKQVGQLVTIIESKRVTLIATASEIGQLITDISFLHPITIVSSAIQKLISTMNTGKLSLLVTPTLASFFLLGTFDPQTLGTLDTNTLGDMDYTV